MKPNDAESVRRLGTLVDLLAAAAGALGALNALIGARKSNPMSPFDPRQKLVRVTERYGTPVHSFGVCKDHGIATAILTWRIPGRKFFAYLPSGDS